MVESICNYTTVLKPCPYVFGQLLWAESTHFPPKSDRSPYFKSKARHPVLSRWPIMENKHLSIYLSQNDWMKPTSYFIPNDRLKTSLSHQLKPIVNCSYVAYWTFLFIFSCWNNLFLTSCLRDNRKRKRTNEFTFVSVQSRLAKLKSP